MCTRLKYGSIRLNVEAIPKGKGRQSTSVGHKGTKPKEIKAISLVAAFTASFLK